MTSARKEQAGKATLDPGRITTGIITREGVEGGSPEIFKELIYSAMDEAPGETRFEVVVIPLKMVERCKNLPEAIGEALNKRKRRRPTGRSRPRLNKQFDPYEAGRAEVHRLEQAEGGSWLGTDLAREFKLSSAVLYRRRKEFRIVFWRDAQGEFHYPKWQFNPAGALYPGIEEVLQIFRSQDEWRVMGYFLNPKKQLGGERPIDLIWADRAGEVIDHARRHAEENTW